MDRFQQLRLLEATLFASAEPLEETLIAERMPEGADVPGLLQELSDLYSNRGIALKKVGKRWAFRTADDLAEFMKVEKEVPKKLSRAAVETLAIIAYHQPVTRAEVEEIRGVALSKGTLDILLEANWIKPKGRRRAPGRPVTWGTSESFLDHFGLDDLSALPGLEELRATGLLDRRPGLGTIAMTQNEAEIPDEEEEDEFQQDALFELEEDYEAVEKSTHIAIED